MSIFIIVIKMGDIYEYSFVNIYFSIVLYRQKRTYL